VRVQSIRTFSQSLSTLRNYAIASVGQRHLASSTIRDVQQTRTRGFNTGAQSGNGTDGQLKVRYVTPREKRPSSNSNNPQAGVPAPILDRDDPRIYTQSEGSSLPPAKFSRSDGFADINGRIEAEELLRNGLVIDNFASSLRTKCSISILGQKKRGEWETSPALYSVDCDRSMKECLVFLVLRNPEPDAAELKIE